jgi:cold shock protein
MAQEGTVKWFSDEKGYGFISPDDGSEDLFVQNSGTEGGGFKTLDRGNRVTFRRPRARRACRRSRSIPPKTEAHRATLAGRLARPFYHLSPEDPYLAKAYLASE